MSKLEDGLYFQIKALKLPEPEKEYRFHPTRKWRFDFAWPDKMIAVEVEGGGWVQGRHTRGAGFEKDLEKYHEAMALGWNIYRCSGALIDSGKAVELIEWMLNREG